MMLKRTKPLPCDRKKYSNRTFGLNLDQNYAHFLGTMLTRVEWMNRKSASLPLCQWHSSLRKGLHKRQVKGLLRYLVKKKDWKSESINKPVARFLVKLWLKGIIPKQISEHNSNCLTVIVALRQIFLKSKCKKCQIKIANNPCIFLKICKCTKL